MGNVPKGTSSNAFTGKNLTHKVIQLDNFHLESPRKVCSNIMMPITVIYNDNDNDNDDDDDDDDDDDYYI